MIKLNKKEITNIIKECKNASANLIMIKFLFDAPNTFSWDNSFLSWFEDSIVIEIVFAKIIKIGADK